MGLDFNWRLVSGLAEPLSKFRDNATCSIPPPYGKQTTCHPHNLCEFVHPWICFCVPQRFLRTLLLGVCGCFFYIKTESDLDTRQYARCKVPGLDSIPFMKLHLQTIGFIIILNRPLLRINLVTGMIMEKETGELA